MIGLVCRTSSLLEGSFAKETYNFKELTNRSHPILIDAYLFLTCLSVRIKKKPPDLRAHPKMGHEC